MPERLLTVDLGNSSCSFVLWDEPGVEARPAERLVWDREEESLAKLERRLAGLGSIDRTLVSSVAGEALTAELEACLARLGGAVHLAPEHGLRLAVESPETVGQDRLYAARGAGLLAPGALIVVDAGTALTVDAVGPAGVFLGGAIAPGPTLLARALAAGGARLPEVAVEPGERALGHDTPSAMAGGIAVGFRGAARALVLEIAADPRLASVTQSPPTVVLTGGAREFLLAPAPFVPLSILEVGDLVHRGLLASLP